MQTINTDTDHTFFTIICKVNHRPKLENAKLNISETLNKFVNLHLGNKFWNTYNSNIMIHNRST
jgi:hypothetical protein